jgi:hypothetical protein
MPDNTALRILREDQKPEKRAAEILSDWRAWAQRAGYHQRLTVPVSSGTRSITLETWEHPTAPDTFLLYHPLIPSTPDTERLYILADKEALESMLGAACQMAQGVMHMLQTRDDIIRGRSAYHNEGPLPPRG